MKPKILHILYSGLGGTTDYVFNLIKGDKNNEFEHHILFYGIEKVPDAQLKLAKQISTTVNYVHKQKGYDKNAFKKVLEYIKNCKPITITLHVNSLILTCSKYKQAKLIFVEHQANHLKTKKEWLWSLIAQRKAGYVICLTEEYQNQLKNKLKFLFKKVKNQIIKTGIDLSIYTSNFNEQTNIVKIGMISRINKFRDHKTLIKAFEKLNNKNIELHIAGEGELLNELKNLTTNSNVIFHGNIEQNKIPKFLSSLSVYCQASFGETSSIALMQAQASGLPIIASNVKGINNILTNDNCIFVEPKSIMDYKKAIKKLVIDNELRKTLSKKSLEFATANLSHFRMFDDYKKLILE